MPTRYSIDLLILKSDQVLKPKNGKNIIRAKLHADLQTMKKKPVKFQNN